MSIRRRLFLSFLVILALFAVNIFIYRYGNDQREKSFRAVEQAMARQVLVGDIDKALAERRQKLSQFKALAEIAGTSFTPGQIQDQLDRVAQVDAMVARLEVPAGGSGAAATEDPLVRAFVQRYERASEEWVTVYQGLSVTSPEGESSDEEGEQGEGEATASNASTALEASPVRETGLSEGEAQSPPNEVEEQDLVPTAKGLETEEVETVEEPPPAPVEVIDPAQLAVEQLAELEERERQGVGEATAAFDQVTKTTDRIALSIFAFSILLALGVALWVSAYLNRGLKTLESGARRIGGGELDHRINLDGRDELTELATAFNAMSENLKAARERVEVARAAAEQANQAKSSFLANMSHELRTPMNAIIGYTEMLTEDAEDLGQDDFIPDLKKILAAGKHLLALINDVLDLSKIEAGKMTLFLEEFEVETLIEDVTTTIQPLVDKNSNRLVIDLDPRAGVLKADETKVRQMLFNLLSNASKFTDQGSITLEVRRFERGGVDWLAFKVGDTGIGMSEAQMAKVFEEFTQADSSTTRKFGGTGLGLTISKKFCQLMGGDIHVESEQDRGTTFTVELPAVVRDPSEPATDEALPSSRSRSSTGSETGSATDAVEEPAETILVIDDDSTTLELTRRFLTREGFAVQTASSGMHGLELAKKLQPSAITLDVMMPGMDGWAVLTALKKDPDTVDIPVIMLTMLDEKEMGFALGASEYMSKPIDRERLTSYLEKYLASSRVGGGRILVVEDDAETRELLRRGLEKSGWSIDEAENGLVALARLNDLVPDLILLDLAMPQMNGFDFLEELRQTEDWQSIPVVVVTAQDLTPEEQARLDGQVEAVLKKGAYARDSLLSELRDLVTDCVARQATRDRSNPAEEVTA